MKNELKTLACICIAVASGALIASCGPANRPKNHVPIGHEKLDAVNIVWLFPYTAVEKQTIRNNLQRFHGIWRLKEKKNPRACQLRIGPVRLWTLQNKQHNGGRSHTHASRTTVELDPGKNLECRTYYHELNHLETGDRYHKFRRLIWHRINSTR